MVASLAGDTGLDPHARVTHSVTSGIDFGLTVAAEIAGETTARTIQLGIEYDPAPPFDAGHPDRAPAAIKSALLSGRYDEPRSAFRAGIDNATRL